MLFILGALSLPCFSNGSFIYLRTTEAFYSLLLILLNFAPLPLLALLVPCDMSPVDDYLISVPLEVDIIN